jgi:cell wall-associated NlpC family hydrolase
MASSLTPVRRRSTAAPRVLITLAAAAGVALSPLPALATPEAPASSAEAIQLVAARAHDLEVVSEQLNDARVQLEAQQAAAAQAAAQIASADAAVGTAREHVREVARSAYTGDQLDTLQAVLTSTSAEEMLDRVGTLDSIAAHNNGILDAAQQAGAAATAAKATADQAAAGAQAALADVTARQAGLQAQIAEYQADVARLTAAEQAAAAAAAEQQQAAAAVDIDRSAPAASRATRPAPAAAPAPAVSAGSGSAQAAVNTALAQVGDPYVWGAAGPDAFDCSGLMQFAYRAAGVSLPHSSSGQSGMGRPVSRDALQPGDLIFFYSPVSHVGMYIGNGQMVHAATSGQPVKVASIDAMGNYNSARRLVG